MRDRPRYYILDEDNHAVAVGFMRWAKWFEDIGNRIVDYTEITSEVYVSTVFLGIDHRHFGDGPPLLFETMIFGAEGEDLWMRRFSSWDDAATGHKVIVNKLRAMQASRAQ